MPPNKSKTNSLDCYDVPQYWDLAFRSETRLEADFFERAFEKYCPFPVRRVFEPGCGGGRLVVEMARRGYQVTACDLSPSAIQYVAQRLARRKLSADVQVADMLRFTPPQVMDAAFCTFNTFRHLRTERDALQHLRLIADCLRPGGLYVLGLHLLPPDADEECSERWTARHGNTRVTTLLNVIACDRERRTETIRFRLVVHHGKRETRIQSDYQLRLYTATQLKQLLRKVPAFELLDVFDFWYELDHPLKLDDRISDTVLLLRKRG